MGYVGDDEMSAPTLNTVHLGRKEAPQLFERVVHNIRLMLDQNIVHGDLSAYNILYWEGEITLIDFPQVIDPVGNRSAYRIFERDVTRICEYFTTQGVRWDGSRLARQLWTEKGFRLVPEVHPRLLDEESEADRALWRRTND
jgi:RIO kinase 1